MGPGGATISPEHGVAHRGPLCLAVALVAVLTGLTLFALASPATANSHDEEAVEITDFTVSPSVIHASGGLLDVHVKAQTSTQDLRVSLLVLEDGSERDRVGPVQLVPQEPGVLELDHDVTVDPRGSTGDWSLQLVDAHTVQDDAARDVTLEGTTTAPFLVNQHAPVGGSPETPWPQSGGDPAHTGRTLSVGPDDVEAERWIFESEDEQAFHTPVIADDGTIYAVTWGGTVYALDEEGNQAWDSPVRLPGPISFTPALSEEGSLIVPDASESLTALTPNGTVDWRYEAAGELLSTPVVGPEGRVFVIEQPWTLVQIEDGHRLYATPLPEPAGGAPETPSVPEPVPGPSLAVTPDGDAIVLSGEGLELVLRNGTVDDRGEENPFHCECTPRAVSLDQQVPRALLVGEDTLSVFSVRTGLEIWRLTEQIPLDGDAWAAPMITWNDRVIVTTEEGRIIDVSLTDPTDLRHVNFRDPIRGQPTVDADHNLFFADACDTVRSITPDFEVRWASQMTPTACHGLSASPVITPNGNLLWPAPDETLRLLGDNRAPVPSFEATWEDGTFHLDATNSTDPDGDALSYAWRIPDRPNLDGRIVQPDISEPGTYTITLTVGDGTTTASTSREVPVNFPPTPRIDVEPNGTTLEANASATEDFDGDPLTYNWTLDGDPAGTGPAIVINATTPRVHDLNLIVQDGHHEVHEQRTVLAPHEDQWITERVALYEGDCPARVCTTPEELTLVNGTLIRLHVINGADRTVDIESPFPLVPGGIDKTRLSPGGSHQLSVRADAQETNALTVHAAHTGLPPTQLPATVNPAPARIAWTVETLDEAPLEGQPADIALRLEGQALPRATTLTLGMHEAGAPLATQRIELPAGEPVDHVVEIPWTPDRTGLHEVRFTVEASDATAAHLVPPDEATATHTFSVQEAPFATKALDTATENAWALALAATGTVAVAASLVAWRRYPREDSPDASTVDGTVPPGDDATVASSFMPRKVERFRVEQVLGEGGFGRTYLAHDTVLERDVVLKELEHVGEGEARNLLLHEAKTGANLSHTNVVVVHDVVEEQGRLLLVMEHVPGGTLQDQLEEPFTVKQALPLVTDMLEGLAALHEAGIVHRDVKPSNILITPERVAKITDFGVAASVEDGTPPTEGDRFVGTPRYMAPEQLAGDAPGPQADVYGAGAVLYRMLTGRHHLGLGEETPSPASLLERDPELPAPEIPEELNRILEIALARDASKRYEDADAFLKALQSFQANPTRAPA